MMYLRCWFIWGILLTIWSTGRPLSRIRKLSRSLKMRWQQAGGRRLSVYYRLRSSCWRICFCVMEQLLRRALTRCIGRPHPYWLIMMKILPAVPQAAQLCDWKDGKAGNILGSLFCAHIERKDREKYTIIWLAVWKINKEESEWNG